MYKLRKSKQVKGSFSKFFMSKVDKVVKDKYIIPSFTSAKHATRFRGSLVH
jgi:hypothetical protein